MANEPTSRRAAVNLSDIRRLLNEGRMVEGFGAIQSYIPVCGAFELEILGRLLQEHGAALAGAESGFDTVSVGVLGSCTTEPLANAVRCVSALLGKIAAVYEAPFGALRQEVLDPGSRLYAEKRDFVLLAPDAEREVAVYDFGFAPGDVDRTTAEITAAYSHWWEILRDRLDCRILQHTFEPVGRHFIGAIERTQPSSPLRLVHRVNEALMAMSPGFVHWIDTNFIATQVGMQNWSDRRLRFHGKFGFSTKFLGAYAAALGGLLRALLGLSKKCIVLDLDNTLWGGVVGDDGLHGIQLGSISAVGEAYADFCLYLRELKKRGILLAVASKNEEATAREVFEKHPDMPLAWDAFAAVRCNWEDKVTNIVSIARQLNIGLGHMVFADDNPAECELVRQQLPEVDVISLGSDPVGFVAEVERGHWFDSVGLSDEDRKRSESYRARRQADEIRVKTGDLSSYLTSLEMKARIGPAVDTELQRLAQMEAKTNQFNLTTRRYGEPDLRKMLADKNMLVVSCHLSDRFADHGLVSSLIVQKSGTIWVIASWLMSCRVFSRTLEQFCMNYVIDEAGKEGVVVIEGGHTPTARNAVVKDLLVNLGFAPVGQDGEMRRFRLEIGGTRRTLTTYIELQA